MAATSIAHGTDVSGYEIHMGRHPARTRRPVLDIGGRFDGAMSPDGKVMGTMSTAFLPITVPAAFLQELAARRGRTGDFGALISAPVSIRA